MESEARTIVLEPIGYVRNSRRDLTDDLWGAVESAIELIEGFGAESLNGLDQFSHVEILFHFHRVTPERIERQARHPRGNANWPRVGIFAQRASGRPNQLGATIVDVVGVAGRVLRVRGLDATDGSPVVDIKPVMREFLPRGEVRQPAWAGELMRDYWAARRGE